MIKMNGDKKISELLDNYKKPLKKEGLPWN